MKLKKKKENIEEVSEETTEEVIEEVEDTEEVTDRKAKIKKVAKENRTYLFFKVFFRNLRENKLYFLSFFITIFTIAFFSINKVQEAEGIYGDTNIGTNTNTPATPVVNPNANKTEEKTPTPEEVDISDFIGIYSREIVLSTPLSLDEQCTIDKYKLVYQVKKDKTITKYLVNDCLGTIKMWSDKANYVSSGGAKYISANKINYLFSPTNMKEVDGETYSSDSTITTLKEKKNKKNVTTYFYGDNVVLQDLNNLYLIKGNTVAFNLNNTYPNNGGNLEQRVYKAGATNQFNFITFSNEDNTNNCYSEFNAEEEDTLVYTIYSIKYNSDTNNFENAKKILSRNKSDKCENYEEDLKNLEE